MRSSQITEVEFKFYDCCPYERETKRRHRHTGNDELKTEAEVWYYVAKSQEKPGRGN